MSTDKPLFTVFTPCYNSERFIHRVYESLCAQTYSSFEWLVIDDASTDATADILEGYRREAVFPVRIIRNPENRMLMYNFNLAVAEAKGSFFLTAGHDDAFVPEALQVFKETWELFPPEEQENLSGVIANCMDQHSKLVGTPFPDSPWIADIFTVRLEKKVQGEKWGFTRTDIMRQYPFNTTEDRYVPEITVWNAIGSKYKAIHINRSLRIYYRNEEDHVSLSDSRKLRFVKGYRFGELDIINNYFHRYRHALTDAIIIMINYVRLSIHSRISIYHLLSSISSPFLRFLILLLIPLGAAKALLDKLQKRI